MGSYTTPATSPKLDVDSKYILNWIFKKYIYLKYLIYGYFKLSQHKDMVGFDFFLMTGVSYTQYF